MAAFLSEVDVVNRALQIIRVPRINAFTDHTLEAQECAFAYSRMRDAELRAHLWRFAVRRAALRAISTDTLLWTPPTWSAGTYTIGQVVADSNGNWWQVRVASTAAAPPNQAGNDTNASWAAYFGPDTLTVFDAADDISFFAGELTKVGATVYMCLVNGTTATPPSSAWRAVNGTTAALQILYPIGAGPSADQATSNVYRLPRGFLRQAPSDPKGAGVPALGAARGNWREDWVFEGNYIISATPGPIMLRFVADFVDVPGMEATFCQMLAARIAQEIAPRVADPGFVSLAMRNARMEYREARREAVGLNAIETGPIDLELGEYLAVRLT